MSLKLNTREMQVKLPGFKAPGLERTAQAHLVRGVQSEREVTWDFGPADVNLGLAEMLRGGMFERVRGVERQITEQAAAAPFPPCAMAIGG